MRIPADWALRSCDIRPRPTCADLLWYRRRSDTDRLLESRARARSASHRAQASATVRRPRHWKKPRRLVWAAQTGGGAPRLVRCASWDVSVKQARELIDSTVPE